MPQRQVSSPHAFLQGLVNSQQSAIPWFCFSGMAFAFQSKKTLFTLGGTIMDNRETQCSTPAVVLALLGGAVAGVVAGLLLAPKSGEETRRALKGYARKTEEEVLERAKEVRAALDETIDRGTRFIAEKTADAEAAVKAGREAMKEKMDKCCN
jgi:gas vesicle protein